MARRHKHFPKEIYEKAEELVESSIIGRKLSTWYDHTKSRAQKWALDTKEYGPENYVEGVARVTNADPEVVKNSYPAVDYAMFAEHAEEKIEDFIQGVERAYKTKKWAVNYTAAYLTPAKPASAGGGGVPAPPRRMRARSPRRRVIEVE